MISKPIQLYRKDLAQFERNARSSTTKHASAAVSHGGSAVNGEKTSHASQTKNIESAENISEEELASGAANAREESTLRKAIESDSASGVSATKSQSHAAIEAEAEDDEEYDEFEDEYHDDDEDEDDESGGVDKRQKLN
jgi:hypothetical protein